MSKPTVAVDFDGVIHAYSKGWQNGSIYDEPIPGALEALRELRQRFRVVIFTSRAVDGVPLDPMWKTDDDQCQTIRDWFIKHNAADLADLQITNRKPLAVAYIDDRAIRFTDWEQALAEVLAAGPAPGPGG